MGEIKRYLKYNSTPPYIQYLERHQNPSPETPDQLQNLILSNILVIGFKAKKCHFVIRFCHQKYFICIFCCCQCTKIITQQFRFFSKKTRNSTTLEFVIFSILFLGHPIASFFQTSVVFIKLSLSRKSNLTQFNNVWQKGLLVRTATLELDAFNIHSDIEIFLGSDYEYYPWTFETRPICEGLYCYPSSFESIQFAGL